MNIFFAARTYPKTGIAKADGCLTLIRKDKFTVKNVNPIHFKNLLSDYDPRLALAVYIQPKSQNVPDKLNQKSKSKDILVLNVHLDGSDYKVRQKQIMEAVERAVLFSAPSEFLVCGDFNEDNVKNMSQELSKYSLIRIPLFQRTSIYGIIDHIYTNLPNEKLGKIELYPGIKGKEKNVVHPPYLDDSFPSDHYILVQDVVLG